MKFVILQTLIDVNKLLYGFIEGNSRKNRNIILYLLQVTDASDCFDYLIYPN